MAAIRICGRMLYERLREDRPLLVNFRALWDVESIGSSVAPESGAATDNFIWVTLENIFTLW